MICNREVAGSNLSLGYFAPRSTQPSILPGSVNKYQLRLGRQRQVWLIPIADERVGVQVKLWNSLRPRAIPERFCGGDSLRRERYIKCMHLYLDNIFITVERATYFNIMSTIWNYVHFYLSDDTSLFVYAIKTPRRNSLAAFSSSHYVTSHPGQLSLAIPPWVGTMSTGDGYGHR